MSDNTQIIELYTELAQNPNKDFGWDKGLENALAHGYKQEWIDKIPSKVWEFCAAVGNPFLNAEIKKGNTVLDLGCGAGVDVLVASLLVGDDGTVFGVDITPKMVEIATTHAKELHSKNVKILENSFDNIDLEDESVDVVISNGAINLTSCKESVFAEIHRVLKPNAKIFFADMIDISQPSSCSIEQSSCCGSNENGSEDWANCVAGTIKESELIELIQKAGFKDVECTGHTHYATAETTKGATFKATKIPADSLREKHWENVFQTKDYTQVLWHQNVPTKSLSLIEQYSKREDSIIDVGCGASFLVDSLISEGYKDITLLDTSKTSLDIVKTRLNANSKIPKYICSDILGLKEVAKYNIWHDRALFHFLLLEKEQKEYFKVLSKALLSKGIAIINTFSIDSQTECAGLPIVQYDEGKILEALPSDLTLIKTHAYTHTTPKNTEQNYNSFIITKK